MKENIILVGGGGHCRSVIDLIQEQGIYQIVGIVDLASKMGSSVLGYKVVATDNDLPILAKEHRNFCVTIGHTKSSETRKNLFNVLKSCGATFPIIKSPNAYVSGSASVDEGTVIMHHSVVNANSKVGACCILNTGCVIEHDVTIADHCHVGPLAAINGGCIIQEDCFIGSKAVVIPGITISRNSLIAAGSVITNDIKQNGMYAGNPAVLKKRYHE